MNNRDRFDKFTERARRVLSLAGEEARNFQHHYIGTEHLLLGLVREGEGVAAKVLANLGVELDKVRSTVEAIIGRGDRMVLGEIGLTPRAKKVIEFAVDEARRLDHQYIGTEHLLLGLVREGEGIAAGVLESLGVNLEKVRTQTLAALSQSSIATETTAVQGLPSVPEEGKARGNDLTTYIDLSQPLENDMTYFPGDPEPSIVPAEVTPPWRVTQLSIVTHLGTHIDAASHFIPHGKTISDYPLERFLLPGMIVPLLGQDDDEPLGPDVFADSLAALPTGGALLIHLGWDQYWKTERYLRHPYLTREAAQLLVDKGVSLVGLDALSVDSTVQETNHAHAVLLGNDVLIVENLMRLHQLLPGVVYHFSFLPLALSGLDGSPIRAIVWRTV